jgi:hypothetical protein
MRSTSYPSRTVSCGKATITSIEAIHDPDHSEAIRSHGYIHCILTRCAAICGAGVLSFYINR